MVNKAKESFPAFPFVLDELENDNASTIPSTGKVPFRELLNFSFSFDPLQGFLRTMVRFLQEQHKTLTKLDNEVGQKADKADFDVVKEDYALTKEAVHKGFPAVNRKIEDNAQKTAECLQDLLLFKDDMAKRMADISDHLQAQNEKMEQMFVLVATHIDDFKKENGALRSDLGMVKGTVVSRDDLETLRAETAAKLRDIVRAATVRPPEKKPATADVTPVPVVTEPTVNPNTATQEELSSSLKELRDEVDEKLEGLRQAQVALWEKHKQDTDARHDEVLQRVDNILKEIASAPTFPLPEDLARGADVTSHVRSNPRSPFADDPSQPIGGIGSLGGLGSFGQPDGSVLVDLDQSRLFQNISDLNASFASRMDAGNLLNMTHQQPAHLTVPMNGRVQMYTPPVLAGPRLSVSSPAGPSHSAIPEPTTGGMSRKPSAERLDIPYPSSYSLTSVGSTSSLSPATVPLPAPDIPKLILPSPGVSSPRAVDQVTSGPTEPTQEVTDPTGFNRFSPRPKPMSMAVAPPLLAPKHVLFSGGAQGQGQGQGTSPRASDGNATEAAGDGNATQAPGDPGVGVAGVDVTQQYWRMLSSLGSELAVGMRPRQSSFSDKSKAGQALTDLGSVRCDRESALASLKSMKSRKNDGDLRKLHEELLEATLLLNQRIGDEVNTLATALRDVNERLAGKIDAATTFKLFAALRDLSASVDAKMDKMSFEREKHELEAGLQRAVDAIVAQGGKAGEGTGSRRVTVDLSGAKEKENNKAYKRVLRRVDELEQRLIDVATAKIDVVEMNELLAKKADATAIDLKADKQFCQALFRQVFAKLEAVVLVLNDSRGELKRDQHEIQEVRQTVSELYASTALAKVHFKCLSCDRSRQKMLNSDESPHSMLPPVKSNLLGTTTSPGRDKTLRPLKMDRTMEAALSSRLPLPPPAANQNDPISPSPNPENEGSRTPRPPSMLRSSMPDIGRAARLAV